MHSEERSSHDVPVDRVHDVLPVREDSVDSEIRQKPSEDEVFLKMKGKNIVSVSVMRCVSLLSYHAPEGPDLPPRTLLFEMPQSFF